MSLNMGTDKNVCINAIISCKSLKMSVTNYNLTTNQS